MDKTYRTSEVAKIIGIHPNTVRLYEKLGLVPKTRRLENGYRIFTQFHIEQFKLVRMAFAVEILQNGLRKKTMEIITTAADGKLKEAIEQNRQYLKMLDQEQQQAIEAIRIAEDFLVGTKLKQQSEACALTRKETADLLHITIDTLRNWEMNGLLCVKRKENGYRIYTMQDVNRLKIIRSLRCANYSLLSILKMFQRIEAFPAIDLKEAIDLQEEEPDMISVCDQLLTSLENAKKNAERMQIQLEKMEKIVGRSFQ